MGGLYLNYAHYNPTSPSHGTCGQSNYWDCDFKIAKVFGSGLGAASLGYINNLPMIAYRDALNGQLYSAIWSNTGTDNCLNGNWHCAIVDANARVAGTPYLFITSASKAAIAYYDHHSKKLFVAEDKAGLCGWACAAIENVNAQPLDDYSVALAQRGGQTIVAYTNRTLPNNTILKVAYPDLTTGNCGPTVGGKPTWRCEVVDDGGGTKSVGKYLAMGVTAANGVYIAYSNDTDGGIKLAYKAPDLGPTPIPSVTPSPTPTKAPIPTRAIFLPAVRR